ncbi:MAG: hypothetical protein AB1782_18735 [Cyanobacteriota bacterium]
MRKINTCSIIVVVIIAIIAASSFFSSCYADLLPDFKYTPPQQIYSDSVKQYKEIKQTVDISVKKYNYGKTMSESDKKKLVESISNYSFSLKGIEKTINFTQSHIKESKNPEDVKLITSFKKLLRDLEFLEKRVDVILKNAGYSKDINNKNSSLNSDQKIPLTLLSIFALLIMFICFNILKVIKGKIS